MRRVKKVYKMLPPHTSEAHPLTNAGEVSKLLIIGIIAIVAVVALSLLLLFSDQLVGKAYFTDTLNSGGAELIPSTVSENQPFSLKIKANVGNIPVYNVNFKLFLPPGMTCADVISVTSLLNWEIPLYDNACSSVENAISFGYQTFDISLGKSGSVEVAQIDFLGLANGDYEFNLNNFNAYSSSNVDQVTTEEDPIVQVKVPTCGDGVINQATEQCDDSNLDSGDGCSSSCLIEQFAAVCGDGTKQTGEQCDDGNNVDGDGCSSTCESILAIVNCGNGIIEAGEECDDWNLFSNDACTNLCKAAVCGDGFGYSGVEECDDSNLNDGDGCSSICLIEQSAPVVTQDLCQQVNSASATDQALLSGLLNALSNNPSNKLDAILDIFVALKSWLNS